MLDARKAENATAKTRRGELCALTGELAAQISAGDGLPCSACGHPVEPAQQLYTVLLRGLVYGLHAPCYGAWVDGRPSTHPGASAVS
jgi:hypothetical protein